MLYKELKIKDKEYKLRLNARNCVDLEKRLGENPINILVNLGQNEKLPSLEVMLTILQAAMQTYQHGISLDDMYNICDEYIDDGHVITDLVTVIIDVFKVSGFFKEEEVTTKNSKERVAKK